MNSRRPVAYLLVAIVCIIVIIPVFWVISTAFKSEDEWFALPVHWFPQMATFSNFVIAFTGDYGVRAITTSLIVGLGSTALAVIIGFPAAYVMSRRITGRFWLFMVPLILRATPPAAIAIPLVVFYAWVGLVDTAEGLILVYSATTVFYIIWMTKPFIDNVPTEVEDAAMIDGVAKWKIPFTTVLPMVAGGVIAAVIFVFVLNWSEFVFALNLSRFYARTIPLQMATISDLGAVSEGQGQAAALSTFSLIPFFLIAYQLQKQLVRTFFVGAVRH